MARRNRAFEQFNQAKSAAAHAEALKALETNTCPDCGAGVHSNLALTGWVQCDRSGSGHFRRDPSGAPCSWQGFTR